MENLIRAFENDADLRELMNLYFYKTVPEIFGISRSELAHSSFLAWLFDPSVNEFGAEPLRLLFELCGQNSPEVITNCKVETERSVKVRNQRGRVDVFIECDVVSQGKKEHVMFIIENKVFSCEHRSQTEIYHKYFEKAEFKAYTKYYIFLTPPFLDKDADCNHFIHLTYQQLLDHILTPLQKQCDVPHRTSLLLDEYIKSLTVPMDLLIDCDGTQTLKSTILAISMDEKNLLRAFWDKHKKLVLAAINALSEDDESPYREETTEAKNRLSTKDYSKYSLNGVGSYGKRRMVEAVVYRYIELNPNTTVAELKEVFPNRLQGKLFIASATDKISDMSRFFESKLRNGEKFYISNQWGNQTDGFVEYVNDNIEGITITKL